MGIPVVRGARTGGLEGPQGQNAGKMGGSPPDRVDQLFGLCTPFRPPVYGTHRVRGNGDSTIMEEVDMSLTHGEGVLTLLLWFGSWGYQGHN